jgi:hypothetical protein
MSEAQVACNPLRSMENRGAARCPLGGPTLQRTRVLT